MDELTTPEMLLVCAGVVFIGYLCFLQYQSIIHRRRRRSRRHRDRRRDHAVAQRSPE